MVCEQNGDKYDSNAIGLFVCQITMNCFEYELTTLIYYKVSQHCMQFSDYHVYDSIKTTKGCKFYHEIELITDNEAKKMKRISSI